ncbi:YkyA family protein [Neobacillus pocheonensis]|uniref:YkyA family protein n=1 Tax=Neobacillus pocheonensis TaxID=363869 RepID=A0ABT0WB54_9BACI|nr:YkyA family protein [Neobacillus pocheonensis]
MSFFGKSRLFLSVFATVILLSGCLNQKTPVEKMYDVLEKVVSAEKGFEEQQEPLVSLEKKEKEIYDQMIGLEMKQFDQLVKLSDEAILMANQRKNHMEKETSSLKKSEQEFKQVSGIINTIDDPALKKMTNELYTTMIKRYRAHDVLFKDYSEALKYDNELYLMFKNKNIPIQDLETQVNKLNKAYQKVYEANENFNNLTKQYNEKKLEFYKKAGLKVNIQ